jgi:hypothetical protein
MIIITRPRKPTIKQSQLDDFLGHPTIKKYNMKNKSEKRIAQKKFSKWLAVEHRKKKIPSPQRSTRGRQTSLYDFLPKTVPPPLPKPVYAWRFRGIQNVLYEDFAIDVISAREWCWLQAMPTFKGYFTISSSSLIFPSLMMPRMSWKTMACLSSTYQSMTSWHSKCFVSSSAFATIPASKKCPTSSEITRLSASFMMRRLFLPLAM